MKSYIIVYIILILITLFEVSLTAGIFSYLIASTIILVLASIKALLIALFYQHLKYEVDPLKLIPLTAFIIISGLLVAIITSVTPGTFQWSTASSP
ncbi:MAG: cytochrome C oxidase subunit IV family protein [Thermoprotei archaeon]|jgi:heme/copper-type cytochrome/quinol oxidase subunit 4